MHNNTGSYDININTTSITRESIKKSNKSLSQMYLVPRVLLAHTVARGVVLQHDVVHLPLLHVQIPALLREGGVEPEVAGQDHRPRLLDVGDSPQRPAQLPLSNVAVVLRVLFQIILLLIRQPKPLLRAHQRPAVRHLSTHHWHRIERQRRAATTRTPSQSTMTALHRERFAHPAPTRHQPCTHNSRLAQSRFLAVLPAGPYSPLHQD
eukprot:476954-Prorocentrum_minimum.AAC.1